MVQAIKRRLRDLSIARKLTVINLVTATTALLVVGGALVGFDAISARQRLVRDVDLLARVVGANSTAALAFRDARAANDTLRGASLNEHIVTAAILTPDGTVLARYDRTATQAASTIAVGALGDRLGSGWHVLDSDRLRVTEPSVLAGEAQGIVYLESDLGELTDRAYRYLTALAVVLVATFGLVLLLSSRLQRVISGPIQKLTDITRQVTGERRYDVRAEGRPAGPGRDRPARARIQRDAVRDSAP